MCSLYQLFIDKYKDVIANEHLQDYAAESQQIVSALDFSWLSTYQLCNFFVKLSEISMDFTSVNSYLSSFKAYLSEVKVFKDWSKREKKQTERRKVSLLDNGLSQKSLVVYTTSMDSRLCISER